ncbi:uncharacterized protein EV420DRAFT_1651505 [Desarmillaria tabescens]|uniref:Uncharacterized protein n=1 Tax=Armillaria tabescens TaxID=1929756 RepID=A0AA39JCZ8_ARMTA|nr:uncharacterized protein EV420DRAFT_1651505 [Desarmillaria tabescens]KAK0438358.1 hypothetical protein EV420DRAFT_1651505 [Desarmillaria tabescens]
MSLSILRSILPRLTTPKSRLQPFLVHSQRLSTRTELEKELFELRESLYTLEELVEHPKAIDYLRDVHAHNYKAHPESSSEERWIEVSRRLKIPESYQDLHEIIYGLTRFSPPQMYLPPTFHADIYKTAWKFLNSFASPYAKFSVQNAIGLVPGLVSTTSLFYNHFEILRNEPIPKCHQLANPLPLGEPVSYKITLHNQIKFVVIEVGNTYLDFGLRDQEVYTRLFTELYGQSASQYNNYVVNPDKPHDLRVYGLLSDMDQNAFFSYDPVTGTFQKDENVCVTPSRETTIHDVMRLSEKLFSVLMHIYNENLEGWYSKEDLPQMYTRIDAETTKPCDRTLPDLLAEAIQDAKLATELLKQQSNGEDALKEGLHLLRKSLWVHPLADTTNYCWLGLHDDLDQMTMKATSNFRREQNSLERKWEN